MSEILFDKNGRWSEGLLDVVFNRTTSRYWLDLIVWWILHCSHRIGKQIIDQSRLEKVDDDEEEDKCSAIFLEIEYP